mgnify:CR=1 FL=1
MMDEVQCEKFIAIGHLLEIMFSLKKENGIKLVKITSIDDSVGLEVDLVDPERKIYRAYVEGGISSDYINKRI